MAPKIITPKNEIAYASGTTVPMDTHWREDNPYVEPWMPGGVRYEEKDSEHGRINALMLESFHASEYYLQIPFVARCPEVSGKPAHWQLWCQLADQPEMMGYVVPLKFEDKYVEKLDERALDILHTLSECKGLADGDRKKIKEKLGAWREKEKANQDEFRQEAYLDAAMKVNTADFNDPERLEWEKEHGNVPTESVKETVEKPKPAARKATRKKTTKAKNDERL